MNVSTLNPTRALRCAAITVLLPLGLTIGCTAQEDEVATGRSSDATQQYTPVSAEPASAVQPAGNGFVRYTATEEAFTVEIPDGWQAYTQIDRSAGFGGIPWSTYASPDNQMVVRVPDRPMTLYMLPNPQLGLYEGGTGGYNRTPVRSYVPAPQYAAEHGWRIAHAMGCQNPQVVDQRDRSDFLRPSNSSASAQGRVTQITVGQATVQCRQGGQSRVIITQASTVGMNNGAWYTSTLHMTAPGAKAQEAARIFEHLNQTTTPNPEWMQQEATVGQRKFAENERLRQQQGRQWAASRPRTTWSPGSPGSSTYSGAASDDAHQAFINSIHGTQDLTDRYGDTVYGVESYSNYHWQDGQGNIVGTDIDENPNPLEYERMGTP